MSYLSSNVLLKIFVSYQKQIISYCKVSGDLEVVVVSKALAKVSTKVNVNF